MIKSYNFLFGVGVGILVACSLFFFNRKNLISEDEFEFSARQRGMIYPSECKILKQGDE